MYRVEMAFGHCDSRGVALLDAQVAAAETIALKGFAQVFRGAQLVRHAGSYLNDYGHLMIEPCTIVWAYVDEIDSHMVHLHAVAATIAAVLRQESVLVMITRIDCVLDWIRPGTIQLADNRFAQQGTLEPPSAQRGIQPAYGQN